jgi:hypothetical protein
MIKCEFCEKFFSNNAHLQRHQKTVAVCVKLQGKTLVESICDYCNKSYTEKSSLNRHLLSCKVKKEFDIKVKYDRKISKLEKSMKDLNSENKKLKKINREKDKDFMALKIKYENSIKEKDEEIVSLKIKCESNHANGKAEVYDKICTKALDKSTVTNNTAYIHPKLVNLPVTNIHPLTSEYVKEYVDNGNYTFDNYLKGENGLVDFIYSITMCENDDGETERNYVCTDPSRDSYHRLVETKEWRKDKGGKFVDVILDALSDKADGYHMKLFDERVAFKSSKSKSKKLEYDPDYIYKLNTDMHSGIVQPRGKDRKILRQKIKKETSRKITI